MSKLRPRTSPGRTERNENNFNNFNSSDRDSIPSVPGVKLQKNNTITILKVGLLVVLIFASIAFAFILGTWREKQIQENLKSKKTTTTKLLVNWKGTDMINKAGDLDGDACVLLSKSFLSKHFMPDPINFPDNPLQACQKTLKKLLNGFDNGFFYEGDRLVGFISGDSYNEDEFSVVNLYNVCVRTEERGKGFAKAMVPEFVRQVIDKRVPKPNPLIYIGLDVDFNTETPVAAFALYAKMGFNRWWEPCSSINEFDFRILKRQHELANPPDSSEKRPSVIFPMSQLFLRRSKTYESQLRDEKGQVYKHFCMVMIWGVDDFGAIGTEMKEIVQSALLLESSKK